MIHEERTIETELNEWAALATAIGEAWQSSKSGVELVEGQRGDVDYIG